MMDMDMKVTKLAYIARITMEYLGDEPNICVAAGGEALTNVCIREVFYVVYNHYRSSINEVLKWTNNVTDDTRDLSKLHKLMADTRDTHRFSNVFWNLYLVAIDEENYQSQAENVADLAASYFFTTDMMEDWCRAVEYVLSGKQLSENCDLVCKSPEGKSYFLHQSNDDNGDAVTSDFAQALRKICDNRKGDNDE